MALAPCERRPPRSRGPGSRRGDAVSPGRADGRTRRDGMPAEDARAQARRQFGNTLLLRESSRDIKLLPRLESIVRDVGFGLRLCLRNKTVTAAAVVSLSLAIGACTAAFSLIDALILRPLPVNDPAVAGLHRVARTRGRPGRPQLQLSPLRRNCAMRAGRRYGCSA